MKEDIVRILYYLEMICYGYGIKALSEKIIFLSLNAISSLTPYGKNEDLVIFGIQMLCQNIKGILMNHYSYNSGFPEVISKKLNEMGFYAFKRREDLQIVNNTAH